MRRPCSKSLRLGPIRLVVALALLLCPTGTANAQGGVSLALDLVVGGLSRPLAVANAGDGSHRLFIAEQTGLVRIWNGQQLLSTPFLDVGSLISCCNERGLLGLAFDPEFDLNGHLYVSYTDLAEDTVIARYTVAAGNPDRADPGSALTLLEVVQPASNHNNGHLAFGPDGYLYIGMGDGGAGSSARGQDLTSLLGKILRIDPRTDGFPAEPNRNYAIPPDNPFVGVAGARDEIWAYGVRNPWRFSFDRELGDLWLGDVGAGMIEEIDLQPAGSIGGENYGWALMEGSNCFIPPTNCNDGSLTLPVLEYTHSFGCAVTGGYRYRGNLEARLRGIYFYADYCSGTVWGTVPSCDGGVVSRDLLASGLSISSFGEDEQGEVYLTHHGVGNGRLLRLSTTGPGGPSLASSTPTLDYGVVPPTTLATLALSLTNTNAGPEATTIERIEPSDAISFSLDLGAGASPCGPPPICLAPGASCTAEVDFSSLGGTFDSQLRAAGNFITVNVDLLAQVDCGGPNEQVVDDTTIGSTAELVACRRLTLGPGLRLASTADVAARAGLDIRLVDGLTVEADAGLRLQNDPSLLP